MKKLLFTIALVLIFNLYSKAQAPNWEWAKSAGGTNEDFGRSVTTDASGNVYITGCFCSPTITFGSITLTSNGNYDIFLVKYGSTGNVLWAKSAGSTNEDWGRDVTTDELGNIYITGFFSSLTITFDSTTLINNGGRDIFLVKYDSTGNVLWAKSAGGVEWDVGYSVTTDASGNVYMSGYFRGDTITFDSTILINNGCYSAFLVKYNATGNVLWAKNAGGLANGYSIDTDASENVYMTGVFSGSITFGSITLTNNGEYGIFLVKYNATGNVLWAKGAAGTDWDEAWSTTSDASGNVYITGYFRSDTITFDSTILTSNGIEDVFLVKYNSTGNMLWAKSAGGNSYDSGHGVTTDALGNVYLTGYFCSPTITFDSVTLINNNSSDTTDIFLVKYDSTGNVLWAKSAGGANSDGGFSVTIDASGNIYITGYFKSDIITFGSTILTNNGIYDIFLVKLHDIIVNINENNFDNEIKLYPNPTNNFVNLEIQNTENEKLLVEITNINGQFMYKKQYNKTANSTIQIDLSSYPKGVYLIKLRTDKFVKVSKLVLQ